MTLIDILRHGEPLGGSKIRGHGIDDPLSETGWGQMWAAVEGGAPWDHVVSSPMRRCLEFAQVLCERQALPLSVEPQLREVGFGVWEGRTREDIIASEPEAYEAFYHDPVRCRPAGAEPAEAFYGRVSASFQALAERHAGRHLLVVAHAGVIRAALTYALGAPLTSMYRIRVEYAGRMRLRLTRYGMDLESLG